MNWSWNCWLVALLRSILTIGKRIQSIKATLPTTKLLSGFGRFVLVCGSSMLGTIVVCWGVRQWEKIEIDSIRHRHFSCACQWLQGSSRKRWAASVHHREDFGQFDAPKEPHMVLPCLEPNHFFKFQSHRSSQLQIIRTAGKEAHVGHWGDHWVCKWIKQQLFFQMIFSHHFIFSRINISSHKWFSAQCIIFSSINDSPRKISLSAQ